MHFIDDHHMVAGYSAAAAAKLATFSANRHAQLSMRFFKRLD